MQFSDLTLSKRLERAEGHACIRYAEAHRQVFPKSGAEWVECGGAYAAFAGADSPVSQTFGLGLFEELNPATLDTIERFFAERGAASCHEMSPMAGVAAFDLLCARNYKPFELSNVLYQPIVATEPLSSNGIHVRPISRDEGALWGEINAKAWAHDHPEILDFLLKIGSVASAQRQSVCFLAELDGKPGAAGLLHIHDGVALFSGAATLPELRRRGLQAALLCERMRYAFDSGCDLAMMVAEPGSSSQRNAERNGFRVAYTRTKWRLSHS